jgi:hypothetical protein
MGGEHDRALGRALVQFFDEDRAQASQPIHHVAIMDNLMAHIDRRAPFREGPLDNLDRPFDAGAKAARRRKQHFHLAALGGDHACLTNPICTASAPTAHDDCGGSQAPVSPASALADRGGTYRDGA